jgi:hypothetical protein
MKRFGNTQPLICSKGKKQRRPETSLLAVSR